MLMALFEIFAPPKRPVAVHAQALEERHAGRVQDDRPDRAVELQDLLGEQVLRAGPARLPLRVRGIADRGQVGDQRVGPHVRDEVLVERKGDAPGEPLARARDAEVAEALVAQHGEHFVAVALGLDQARVLRELGLEPGEVARALEEVVRLAPRLERARGMLRALAADQVALGLELLAADAVLPGVLAQLDLALVVERLPQVLDCAVVLRVGGAHEALRLEPEREPLRAELLGHAVDERLGALLLRGRGLGDLLAVLVGAGDEERVLARPARW